MVCAPQFMPKMQCRATSCEDGLRTEEPSVARPVPAIQTPSSHSSRDVHTLLTVLLCLWCLVIGWFAHSLEQSGNRTPPIAESLDWLDEMRFGIWRQVLRRV